jgi:hypothetical protein
MTVKFVATVVAAPRLLKSERIFSKARRFLSTSFFTARYFLLRALYTRCNLSCWF